MDPIKINAFLETNFNLRIAGESYLNGLISDTSDK